MKCPFKHKEIMTEICDVSPQTISDSKYPSISFSFRLPTSVLGHTDMEMASVAIMAEIPADEHEKVSLNLSVQSTQAFKVDNSIDFDAVEENVFHQTLEAYICSPEHLPNVSSCDLHTIQSSNERSSCSCPETMKWLAARL